LVPGSKWRKILILQTPPPYVQHGTREIIDTNNKHHRDHQKSELQKVNTFTPKVRDSRQIQRYKKCVIRDISILKRLKNSVKHTDKDTFGFQLLSQTFQMFYTTIHNIFHQDFYPSWEIFTRAALAPLTPFCSSVRNISFYNNTVQCTMYNVHTIHLCT